MADTRRRVKLYMLNEDRQWDDRGTGHVSSSYVERLRGMSLIVRSENDGNSIWIDLDTARDHNMFSTFLIYFVVANVR